MDMTPFKELMKEKCGLVFKNEGLKVLGNAVRDRMAVTGLGPHPKYLDHLIRNENEFYTLVNLLTINETYFFREDQHFNILTGRLVPELLKGKNPRKKIKILSAGCSTGEEPYTVAMALLEKYGAAAQDIFSIMAVDIDTDVIRTAKQGVFGKKSFRKFDGELKKKYFQPVGGNEYKISDSVKEMVKFQNFNLLSDLFPKDLQGMDIIFYRNVSIYFESDTQRNIFQGLSRILNDKGHLIVSSTETFYHNVGILSLTEMDGSFLYHKGLEFKVEDRRKIPPGPRSRGPKVTDSKTRPPVSTGFPQQHKKRVAAAALLKKEPLRVPVETAEQNQQAPPVVERRKEHKHAFDEALALAKNKRYEEALTGVDTLINQDPSFIKAYNLKVSILINLQQTEEAKEICLNLFEMDQWQLEGYLLMGLIARIENDEKEIMKRFKEALYVEPSCWLAHFYLAEFYHSHGELEQACREYGIVVKLLEKGDLSQHGLTLFPLSFPAEQLVHLCHHNLKKLKERLK